MQNASSLRQLNCGGRDRDGCGASSSSDSAPWRSTANTRDKRDAWPASSGDTRDLRCHSSSGSPCGRDQKFARAHWPRAEPAFGESTTQAVLASPHRVSEPETFGSFESFSLLLQHLHLPRKELGRSQNALPPGSYLFDAACAAMLGALGRCRCRARRRFARGGNVFRSGALQNFLSAFHFVGRGAVYRQENAALLNAPFVTLRFVLGNAHADQRAGNSANGPAHTHAGECRHDWSRRYERSDAGNWQPANAGPQAERTAKNRARAPARGSPFRSFGGFFRRNRLGPQILRKQNGDIGLRKARLHDGICSVFRGASCRVNSKNCCFLISHVRFSLK